MDNNVLKVLVISDLHAILREEFVDDSYLSFVDGDSEYGIVFAEYVNSLNEGIDLLICAGDVSNKACVEGFEAGWRFLHWLKESIGAKELICVPGNHDHQSRLKGDVFSPKHNLQFVTPPFPLPAYEDNTHFWAWNWCKIPHDDCNIIIVNSSAYHGFGEDEHKKGRISQECCDQIVDYINSEQFERKKINILVTHHHPYPMDHVDYRKDTESMDGGENLINMINETYSGAWLVIHGHRHYAEIKYGQCQTSCPPVILSAGSFSARLYKTIQDRTSNQFYILDIDLDESEHKEKVVGQFRTFERPYPRAWRPSKATNLPARGGFGGDASGVELAKKIHGRLGEENPFLESSDLADLQRDIQNLMPAEFKLLISKLEGLGLLVSTNSNEIIQVGDANA